MQIMAFSQIKHLGSSSPSICTRTSGKPWSSDHPCLFVQADPSSCSEIQRRYADHLYSKHDYDGAMTQYVATIGYLEPSYVIRKFLDAQRIHNLTSYLEQLHEQVGTDRADC